MTVWEGLSLQRDRGKQTWKQLHLGLLASRTVRKLNSVTDITQSVAALVTEHKTLDKCWKSHKILYLLPGGNVRRNKNGKCEGEKEHLRSWVGALNSFVFKKSHCLLIIFGIVVNIWKEKGTTEKSVDNNFCIVAVKEQNCEQKYSF